MKKKAKYLFAGLPIYFVFVRLRHQIAFIDRIMGERASEAAANERRARFQTTRPFSRKNCCLCCRPTKKANKPQPRICSHITPHTSRNFDPRSRGSQQPENFGAPHFARVRISPPLLFSLGRLAASFRPHHLPPLARPLARSLLVVLFCFVFGARCLFACAPTNQNKLFFVSFFLCGDYELDDDRACLQRAAPPIAAFSLSRHAKRAAVRRQKTEAAAFCLLSARTMRAPIARRSNDDKKTRSPPSRTPMTKKASDKNKKRLSAAVSPSSPSAAPRRAAGRILRLQNRAVKNDDERRRRRRRHDITT